YGPFVSRNALATWLAMAVPIAVGYAMARDQSDRRSNVGIAAKLAAMDSTQLWLAGAACLMTGAVFASMSRAGILAIGAGVLAFVAVARGRIHRGGAVVWASVGLGALALIGLMFA